MKQARFRPGLDLGSFLAALVFAPVLAFAASAPGAEVIDQTGRRVAVPADVRRVVAIPIPLASMVMAVDGDARRLAGMNRAAADDLHNGLLGRMFPAALDIPVGVAGEDFIPNVEALAVARPDVVIQWGDRGSDIVRPIADLGLPVITLRYGDSALAAGWLRLTGAALGKRERGEELAAWFETARAGIAARADATPPATRPRVLFLFRTRSGWQAAGKGTSMDSDIRLAGGLNVAADLPGFAPVGIEQVLAWNPQVLLLNNFEPSLAPAQFYRDPRLAALAAVRERRVYIYPRGGFRWDPPSQETPLALDWLFSLFHPDRAEAGLRGRVEAAYRMLYGYRASAADIDAVLRLDLNGDSARYRAFFAESGQTKSGQTKSGEARK